jgi:integrase
MRGHVHRRGKTWSYVVDVGRDPATGRRRQHTKGGFPTKKTAESALNEALGAVGSGSFVARDPQTVAEWIDRWLISMEPKIGPSTLCDYGKGLHRVRDHLGHVKLQDLKPLDVEALYAELLREGHRYGGGLSPKTVRNLHIALRRSLADAERFGLVTRNVAALVKAPVPPRAELRTWTPDETRTFLASVEGDRLAAAWRLLIATGMRRGELLGLRWAVVDLKNSRVQINRSLSVVGNELVWSAPKTARSRRIVSIDAETTRALQTHRKRQLEERVAAGEEWTDNDLVFCNQLGKEQHPDRFSRAFTQAERRAGVPMIRLHDLRHTWATLALQAGVHPKVVSERLGHATTSITLDIYSHVQPELDAQAATTVAQLFDPIPDPLTIASGTEHR